MTLKEAMPIIAAFFAVLSVGGLVVICEQAISAEHRRILREPQAGRH